MPAFCSLEAPPLLFEQRLDVFVVHAVSSVLSSRAAVQGPSSGLAVQSPRKLDGTSGDAMATVEFCRVDFYDQTPDTATVAYLTSTGGDAPCPVDEIASLGGGGTVRRV